MAELALGDERPLHTSASGHRSGEARAASEAIQSPRLRSFGFDAARRAGVQYSAVAPGSGLITGTSDDVSAGGTASVGAAGPDEHDGILGVSSCGSSVLRLSGPASGMLILLSLDAYASVPYQMAARLWRE